MVDPVTAALTGIALVTKVSETIKQGIGAYKSVAEMGDQLDLLFKGDQELMRARNKQAAKHDNFSTESVAKEILEHKASQERLREVGVAVDMRWGHGTWQSILAERQRRIQEAREAARKAAIEKRRKHHENMEHIKAAAVGVTVLLLMIGAFLGAFVWI